MPIAPVSFKPRRSSPETLPEPEEDEQTEGGEISEAPQATRTRINLQLTSVERDRFMGAARARGLSLSAWLRDAGHAQLVIADREADIAQGRRARAQKALREVDKAARTKAVELAEKAARALRAEARQQAADEAVAWSNTSED